MNGRGWVGNGPYSAILPGTAGGGGFVYSAQRNGPVQKIGPGRAAGGGHMPSAGQPLSAWSGGGNTGPGTGNRR